jgi:hypothetical protein
MDGGATVEMPQRPWYLKSRSKRFLRMIVEPLSLLCELSFFCEQVGGWNIFKVSDLQFLQEAARVNQLCGKSATRFTRFGVRERWDRPSTGLPRTLILNTKKQIPISHRKVMALPRRFVENEPALLVGHEIS